MKKLGEICSISYYALDKADVVIDEYTFQVISKSLESVFNMVPIAAQDTKDETRHIHQHAQVKMPSVEELRKLLVASGEISEFGLDTNGAGRVIELCHMVLARHFGCA